MAYSELSERDFIPMNLKIGNSFLANFDAYNKVTFSLDLQRLLVPTPPIYDLVDGEVTMLAGMNPNVGVINGIGQSFYDAPGALATDENGDYILDADGNYEVVSGTRFKEEISEINIAFGVE